LYVLSHVTIQYQLQRLDTASQIWQTARKCKPSCVLLSHTSFVNKKVFLTYIYAPTYNIFQNCHNLQTLHELIFNTYTPIYITLQEC